MSLSSNEIKGLPKLDSDDKPVTVPDLYGMDISGSDNFEEEISLKDIDALGKEIGTENLAEKHASEFIDGPAMEPSVNYFNRSPDMFIEKSQRLNRENRKKERDLFKIMNKGLRGVYKQQGRKKIADNRPRVKGRFVKTEGKVRAGSKKLTKAKKKARTKARTKAKRDLMKAKKTLKRALARYNKVMKM